jgi:segregation and condensation protein B
MDEINDVPTPEVDSSEESAPEHTGVLVPTDAEGDAPAPDPSAPQPVNPEAVDTAGAETIEMFTESHAAPASAGESEEARKLAILEAIVYVTDEPLNAQQIATALNEPVAEVKRLLDKLTEEFNRPEHGLSVKEVAGGYKLATKPEHHEAVRQFVKNLNPPLKLSLAALETLAVVAYKQPITAPEIMEIRGVQGAGVLKTLLDRKLITSAGRKSVIGKPILYKTTRDFLVQFGLKDLSELPSLKEFEELRRLAFSDVEEAPIGTFPSEAADAEPAAPPESAAAAGTVPEQTAEEAANLTATTAEKIE